jgi:hypothetical protein
MELKQRNEALWFLWTLLVDEMRLLTFGREGTMNETELPGLELELRTIRDLCGHSRAEAP